MAHILAISSLSTLYFLIFPISLFFTCKSPGMVINSNNIWSLNFNLGITMDCKILQNLVHFLLNNFIEYICIHCHASFYISFGPTSYICSQYVIQSRFLLYTFYIEGFTSLIYIKFDIVCSQSLFLSTRN